MAVAVKEKCLAKKCTVQLKKMALSQLTVTRQLKELAHHAESGLASDDESVIPEANKSESDHTLDSDHPDGHTHSRKTDKREIASDTQAVYNSRSVDQTQSIDPGSEKREAPLTAMLKEKCLTEKLAVEVKRATLSKQKETVQCKDAALESPTDVSESDHTANTHQLNRRRSMKVDMKKRGSANSGDKIASDNEETVRNSRDVVPKRKKASVAPKEKKTRSMSTDRPGTSRKACVSGLSVSRWKNKGNTSTHIFQSRAAQGGRSKVVDCSLNELLSAHHKQPKELHGASVIFSTPVKASRLNLSCLLADLTPDTHTWSRLKAALSVHRKTKVLLTPSSRPMPGFSGRAELADVSQDLFASPLLTPLPERFRSQLLRSASVAVCEEADLSDAEKVCAECGQQGPLPWEECILPQRMKQCAKIGEGTFGEVFSTTNASGDTVALKIIPIEGSEKVNGEDQKTFGEILHEIIISKELSSLKEKQHNQTCGFIGLNDLHCVRGCYPPALLTAWDAFDQHKGSENDRPDFFEKEQLFLILEFEFGGSDLENCNGTLTSLVVAKSILHQVTAALAVAEQELHFEHRDLHWGNVLVKTTKQKKGSFLLNGTAQSLDTRGVLVRIIDYSLSRLEIDGLTVSCDISADEELFMGQGDYQFDIYRLMRQENGNNWSNYQPHSNVLWLHYLCSKLLSMKYRRPGGKGAKDMREELARFHDNILQYRSATEALQNCPMFQ
uniref:serine/threonine-protein kinase haspin n=1 Tax=Centroberyx gerrardi TaxID=166262 RepID=UPI003AACD941